MTKNALAGRTVGFLLGLSTMLIAGGLAAQPHPEKEPELIAYRGASVLEIEGGEWRDSAIILVRGERIEAVLPAGSAVPDGARVSDMTSHFAVPGLIDVHQHYAVGPPIEFALMLANRAIHGGVTSARDMTGDSRIIAYLARQTRLGEIAGPDIDHAALMAGPSFLDDRRMAASRQGIDRSQAHWIQDVTEDTDLAQAVAVARGTGATGIKIYGNLTRELVSAIISEAHRQGMKAWVHGAVFPTTPAEAAEAGADTLSHICMLAYQIQRPPPASYDYADRPELDEQGLMTQRYKEQMQSLYALLRQRGTIVDTTLYVYPTIERMRAEIGEGGPPIYCSTDLAAHIASQAHRAGVRFATGSDAWSPVGDQWPALISELELLRDRAGIAPIEVLRAATVNGAEAIGREDEVGRIDAGMLANIVFFSSDPLAQDGDFRSIALTVKRGRPYWRRDYEHTVPDRR